MHPYQNQYMLTGAGQTADVNGMAGQNFIQLQCQPTYYIQPQQLQYMQMQYPVNNLANRMAYSPYLMYTQLSGFPTYQTYPLNSLPQTFPNMVNSNQIAVQVVPQNTEQNYISMTPSSMASVPENNCDLTAVIQSINHSNINLNEQSQTSIQQEKILNKSENTIRIHQNLEQKKNVDFDFLSSSSQSIARQRQNKKEQQKIDITQKSPLLLLTQQRSKQTSDTGVRSPISPEISIAKNENPDNFSNDSSQQEKNEVNKQGIHYNQKGSLIFNLSPKEIDLLKQLSGINIQNAFKNILKGFTQYVNSHFNHIYVYDYNPSQNIAEKQDQQDQEEQIHVQGHDIMSVKRIENPSGQQKKTFIQKFNKFIKNKKYNNTSIRQIIENKLYSTVLKDYIVNNSSEWIRDSSFQNKEDIMVVLQFFKMCCDNSNLLLFLSKTNDKLIPLSSSTA